ncbi:hypothetical protein ACB092_04G052100 [Castanea dentata]
MQATISPSLPQLNGSTFSGPPFSSSIFVGATHLSLTTVSAPLSPFVLLSHNPVDTWVSTTGLENRRAFANIWSNMVFGISLFILLYFNQAKIRVER